MFAIVIKVEFIAQLFELSQAVTLAFITLFLVTFTVMFWLITCVAPDNENEKLYLFVLPVKLKVIFAVVALPVMNAVMLSLFPNLIVSDALRFVMFIAGGVVSAASSPIPYKPSP